MFGVEELDAVSLALALMRDANLELWSDRLTAGLDDAQRNMLMRHRDILSMLVWAKRSALVTVAACPECRRWSCVVKSKALKQCGPTVGCKGVPVLAKAAAGNTTRTLFS